MDEQEKRLKDRVRKANDAVKAATPGSPAMARAVARVNAANRALLKYQEEHS